jgi:hypothetical protein
VIIHTYRNDAASLGNERATFRIVVTAQAHAAIDNLIGKMITLVDSLAAFSDMRNLRGNLVRILSSKQKGYAADALLGGRVGKVRTKDQLTKLLHSNDVVDNNADNVADDSAGAKKKKRPLSEKKAAAAASRARTALSNHIRNRFRHRQVRHSWLMRHTGGRRGVADVDYDYGAGCADADACRQIVAHRRPPAARAYSQHFVRRHRRVDAKRRRHAARALFAVVVPIFASAHRRSHHVRSHRVLASQ